MAYPKFCRNLRRFLRTNRLAIKVQVVLFITFAHVHHPYKKYYDRFYSTRGKHRGSILIANEPAAVPLGGLEAPNGQRANIQSGSQAEEGAEIPRQGGQGNMFELAAGSNEWNWRGVPEERWFIRLYEKVSISLMVYASLRTIFGGFLFHWFDQLLGPWLGISGHCLFMGRFVVHPSVDHIAPLVMSSFHLLWRASQRFLGRRYMLGPVTFLLQTDHDIIKFVDLMSRNQKGTYLTATSEPLSVDLGHKSPSVMLMSRRLQSYSLSYSRHSMAQKEGAREQGVPVERLSVHEHFMRHLMCYEVHSDQGVHYKLRPNRTLSARNKLARYLTNSSLFSAASMVAFAAPLSLFVTVIILSDFRYVQMYPGCYPELDRLFAEGKLSFWSHTLRGHHLLSAVFDGFENLIIWFDSGFAMTFVLALTYFINCDLLLYWRHLHQRLELANKRMRDHSRLRQHFHDIGRPVCCCLDKFSNAEAGRLSALINEIQFETYDFFLQVERADSIVSDILTAAIVIWLGYCAILSYYYLTRMQSGMPLLIKVIQLFGLFVITLASKYLLTLHQCCLRSYKLICTLMAHEQTPKTKRQFMRVLEFFSERNRTTYTLFQHYPYLATTYITLIGWTLSCFAVSYALFGRDYLNNDPGIFGKHKYFSF